MSYIALARKWRPRSFSELLGQTHLTRVLTQSLIQNRVHHAYLFTGTRGVGKTSVARIMAKALNCERGVSAEPCLSCTACLSIEQGHFVDLIEIDAASKTRVEDTRELLDNVPYAPTIGRFKIYLIDEVHMLSAHSFNALLKTLEEPPAHVKFLLATTDPQKLPITILSRCLQLGLKPVPETVIVAHLAHILQAEALAYEAPALSLLAKAAAGSMRDALSLLDQAIVNRSDSLSTVEVAEMLGYSTEKFAEQIIRALIAQDPEQLISISRRIAKESGHFSYVLEELLNCLHQLALVQALPEPLALEIDPFVMSIRQELMPEDTQLFYQIALQARHDLMDAPTLLLGFEMMLLRMYTFRPYHAAPHPPLAYQHQEPPPTTPPHNTNPSPVDRPDWGAIIKTLGLSGLALTAMQHTEFLDKKDDQLIIKLEKAHQSLFTKPVIAKISQALSHYFGEPLHLSFEHHPTVTNSPAIQQQAERSRIQEACNNALESDSVFQRLKEEFSANLVKDSIAVIEDPL